MFVCFHKQSVPEVLLVKKYFSLNLIKVFDVL